jgi:hypothetical protein
MGELPLSPYGVGCGGNLWRGGFHPKNHPTWGGEGIHGTVGGGLVYTYCWGTKLRVLGPTTKGLTSGLLNPYPSGPSRGKLTGRTSWGTSWGGEPIKTHSSGSGELRLATPSVGNWAGLAWAHRASGQTGLGQEGPKTFGSCCASQRVETVAQPGPKAHHAFVGPCRLKLGPYI